jgi:hypothetical protein
MMKRFVVLGIFSVVASWSVTPAHAQSSCQQVSGKLNELIMPQGAAPNDPAGRVLGNVDGSLEGATTAFINSLAPIANGGLHVTTYNAYATQEGNFLFATGIADWTFVKSGFYQQDLTLTVVGGTGRYSNATGSIHVVGIGNNVGPGTGQFLSEYRGQVCAPQ